MIPVSVIIPIYGVERYIERCVRSLFEQSLQGIEFIFVNDCTKDNSMTILERLVQEYSALLKRDNKTCIIINLKKNGGLPQARWHGILRASGTYIAHCDSDDWVEKDMYELMFKKAQSSQADMVVCDFFYSSDSEDLYSKAYRKNLSKEGLYRNLFTQTIPWFVWNKMIKTDCYQKNRINIPQKTQGEDMAFTSQLLYYIDKIEYVETPLYHYAQNTITPTHKQDEASVLKRYDAFVDNVNKVESFYKGFPHDQIIDDGLVYMKLIARWHLTPLLSSSDYSIKWRETFPEIDGQIYNNPIIKFKHKVRYFLLEHRVFYGLFK